MTASSSLAHILSEPLRQPFWWAALASVSLHGVFGANAPTISNIIYGGGNSSKNIPGSVGLVELTPAEAGRLPQTIPPRLSNKPFSIAPVPLRTSPKLAAPPALPTIDLPAPPAGMPSPGFSSPFPPLPPLPPSPAPTASPSPKPPSPTPKPASPNPRAVNPRPDSSERLPPPRNSYPPSPPSPSPSQPLTELPVFPIDENDRYDPDKLSQIIAQRGIEGLSDPNALAKPLYPTGETNSGVDRAPNLPGKSLQRKNPIAIGPGRRSSPPFDRNKREPDREQSDSNLRGNPEIMAKNIRDRYFDLWDKFRVSAADLLPVGQIFSVNNVPYPEAACSDKLEGKVIFGVVVRPEGSIQATPEIIMATGYPILDDAAMRVFKSPTSQQTLRFPRASTHTLNQLEVEFKYDPKICGGAPLPPGTGSIELQPALTPSPAPAPAPAPTPSVSPEPAPAPVPPPSASPKPAPGATEN